MLNMMDSARVAYESIGDGIVHAFITIGEGEANEYAVKGGTEGSQIFRTQYDIAVDGSEYILTAGMGRGSCTFTIFEGPFECLQDAPDTFACQFSRLSSYKSRLIDVVIPLDEGTAANQNSTENNIAFSGVIIGANTRQVMTENDGSYYLTTLVQAEGVWR